MTSINPRGEHIRGFLALLACALLWSTGGLFIKLVDWQPVAIAGLRSLLAALVMLALGGIKPGFKPSLRLFVGAGLYCLTMIFFVVSNKLTSAANAILLQYTCPIWTALGAAIVLKERPKARDLVFIALTLAAMVLFFLDKLSARGLLGNLVAVASGLCFGLSFVFIRSMEKGRQTEPVVFSHILTFAVSIPWTIHAGPPHGIASYAGLFFLGIFQIGIAGIFMAFGLARLGALESVLITSLEPVLNPVWVLIFFGEKPGPFAICGGIAIVAMIAIRPLLWRNEGARGAKA